MNSPIKKAPDNKQRFSNGTFAAVTFAAVIIAVVLITMGRISSSTPVVSLPTASPTETTLPSLTPTPDTATPPSIPTIFDTSKGSDSAPVTIIEYSEFQCAHCQQFALTIERELDELYVETGKVRIIYKFMIGYGEESFRANQAAACAAEQGQFWPYYYLLMQQRASPVKDDLPIELLQGIAQQVGLNMDSYDASLFSGKYEVKVRKDDADGRALGVIGTPTFFINGIKKDGAKSLRDLQEIIDPMLENLNK